MLTRQDAVLALNSHLTSVVLPTWRTSGFNFDLRLPFEAVSAETGTPMPAQRYRAMACARQLYLFSLAKDLVHAKTLFESLLHYFADTKHGGWIYSVDEAGLPKERQKDLYTHAFVIFAAAQYALETSDPSALDMIERTTHWIEERFSVDCGKRGLYDAVMSDNFCDVLEGPRQNPLMHLVEAWLAARHVTGRDKFDGLLGQLAEAACTVFVDRRSGCIAELPIGTDGNRLEPGHQFEWYFLAFGNPHHAFQSAQLCDHLIRAFSFSVKHGVDPKTGGVWAALNADGTVLDSTQRIWAQTEYLRALGTHTERHVRDGLTGQIERFRHRFLQPRGWWECLSADGTIIRRDMPSTTPYHLATAFSALTTLG